MAEQAGRDAGMQGKEVRTAEFAGRQAGRLAEMLAVQIRHAGRQGRARSQAGVQVGIEGQAGRVRQAVGQSRAGRFAGRHSWQTWHAGRLSNKSRQSVRQGRAVQAEECRQAVIQAGQCRQVR
jgi:hypothetical protein